MTSPSRTCAPSTRPTYAVSAMLPTGPRYFTGSAIEVSRRRSVPTPPSVDTPGRTTEKSRQPSACETASPGEKPSARDSTTSPTVRISSIAALSGKELKYPSGPLARSRSRMPGSTDVNSLRTSTSPSAGAGSSTSATRKCRASTGPRGYSTSWT